jgi:hypothetical protein
MLSFEMHAVSWQGLGIGELRPHETLTTSYEMTPVG